MSNLKNYLIVIPIVLIVGIVIGLKLNKVIPSDEEYSETKKFNEILNYADKYYFKEINREELIEQAIHGMMEELDPHSIYIPAEDQIGIAEQFKGKFDGVGIEFQIINDTLTVVAAVSGGPSEAVGIMSGDRIIEIDNKSVIGITNEEVVSNLRGDKGTVVQLKIYRPFLDQELNFTIIRDQIPLFTVDAALMVSDSIAYISLSKFAESSIHEMKDALRQLTDFGMKKLILDLRNNPGGYMDQAFQIADLFIDSTKLIVYTKGRSEEIDDEYRAEGVYPYELLPLAILVNKGSASASEIVTGAIQDWDRGIIVGETTFGKGLVQRPFILEDNSAVRITISKYYTPSGREIQRDYENEADYFGIVHLLDEKEGENLQHNAEIDSTDILFKTSIGRKIKANGGITPDFIVKNKDLTYYSILLRSKDLYYKFVRQYLDKYGAKIISKYNHKLNEFVKEFSFSEKDINSFIKFASSNGVEFVEGEFIKDRTYIELRLKAHVARNFWKSEGWYSVILTADKQFNKAKQLLIKNVTLN